MVIFDGNIKIEAEISPYDALIEVLPTTPDCAVFKGYWREGDLILADSEARANALADLLDSCGFVAVTGYYDPKEDKQFDQVDSLTGYWYVDV